MNNLSFGTRKICPPDIFLIIWLVPSLAAPARADNPSVLPIAGATALNAGNTALKIPLPVCFLILFVAFPARQARGAA